MKLLTYEAFCKMRAKMLKDIRKSMGFGQNILGETIFGKDAHPIDYLENCRSVNMYKSDYLLYVYDNLLFNNVSKWDLPKIEFVDDPKSIIESDGRFLFNS